MLHLYISGQLNIFSKSKPTNVGTRCEVFVKAEAKYQTHTHRDQSGLVVIQGNVSVCESFQTREELKEP